MQDIIKKLHPLERKVLPHLKEGITLKELIKLTGLQEVEVMRALQWLENKKLIHIEKSIKEIITLDKNGEKYLKEGLPEKQLLKQINEKTKASEIKLPKQELNASIGILRKNLAINIEKENNELLLTITKDGKEYLEKETFEEKLLKSLPKETKDLEDTEKFAYNNLKKRKGIIKTIITKQRKVKLLATGEELLEENIDTDLIDKVTPSILEKGTWKNKEFRGYDIKINVPKISAGRRQPYMQFLNDIKAKMMQLGFQEMAGPLIETEFYNFDVLFQPQNHPARTWTDTYHLKNPTLGKLPDKKIVNAIKNAHETGADTGSKGWRYKWDPEIAMRLMPRAHGTALSARQLTKGIKTPCKYFAIARCYRPDVLDATHLIEFNQMEGFVADENLTFKHLLGILKQFAIEVAGAEEVKFYPDYYPFTEPSVQMSAKHPTLGWVEFGGAGIFRPELTEPLGIKTPVIAWGLGIDRLAMFKLGIDDIRYLFTSDIKWLRKVGIV